MRTSNDRDLLLAGLSSGSWPLVWTDNDFAGCRDLLSLTSVFWTGMVPPWLELFCLKIGNRLSLSFLLYSSYCIAWTSLAGSGLTGAAFPQLDQVWNLWVGPVRCSLFSFFSSFYLLGSMR
ncbi:hypothetical protein TNCV_3081031 [Trichonephila clavipes]|nr:hypothetical protein TNCV_3081031 [Trichonephila clavipes]